MLFTELGLTLYTILTLFLAQSIAQCLPALPTTEVSDFKTCTTVWLPIPYSCNTLGEWKAPNLFLETTCRARGCSIRNSGTDNTFCSGTPCCSLTNSHNTLLCEAQVRCTCIAGTEDINGKCVEICAPGTKRVNGVCRSIICAGDHTLGETWIVGIPFGRLQYTCQEGGIIRERGLCPIRFYYDKIGRRCESIDL